MLKNRFAKFLGAGVANTILTYVIYVFFVLFLNYKIAYSITFVIGIVISYFLNSKYVFLAEITFKKLIVFPVVYVVQYFIGLFLLDIFIKYLQINKFLAPIFVVIVTVPINYLMIKNILTKD